MKKVIFGFFVLTLVFATSCKKSNSSPHGTWSFKGSSVSPSSSVNGNTVIAGVNVGTPGGGVTATSGTNELTITFSPAVTASNPDITLASGNVTVSYSSGTTIYTGGTSGAVSETYSTGGNTNVSSVGSGIMLYNNSSPYDSAVITFNGIN
jgi:hypothetical protein